MYRLSTLVLLTVYRLLFKICTFKIDVLHRYVENRYLLNMVSLIFLKLTINIDFNIPMTNADFFFALKNAMTCNFLFAYLIILAIVLQVPNDLFLCLSNHFIAY